MASRRITHLFRSLNLQNSSLILKSTSLKSTLTPVLLRSTCLHTLPELPFDADLGLEPALSSKSIRLIYKDFQQHWIDSLNKMVVGSKYDKEDLSKIIQKTSTEIEDRVLYNTASIIWNVNFCLKSLSKEPTTMNAALNKLVLESFGSYENMVQKFQTQAQALFGGGFIWLVFENTKLKIVVTPNAESLLYPFKPTAGGLPRSNELESERTPLLGINLWGYGYILDYGLDKSKYIENILSQVDWNTVYKRFQDPRSRSTFRSELFTR